MKQEFLNKPEEFTPDPGFSVMAIDSISLYISGIITKLKTGFFTKTQILIIARDTENSLMETNYQKILVTKNQEYLRLVNILIQQTQEHKKLITNKIRSGAGI